MRGLKHLQLMSCFLQRGRTRMGAWIETPVSTQRTGFANVAPVWVRGLKPLRRIYETSSGHVAPVWVRGLKPVLD